MDQQYSANIRYQRKPDQLFSEIEGEIVMLNIQSSVYFGLNDVSSDIWGFIDSPKRIEEIVGFLMDKYDVDHKTCVKETENFLSEAINEGIIQIVDI